MALVLCCAASLNQLGLIAQSLVEEGALREIEQAQTEAENRVKALLDPGSLEERLTQSELDGYRNAVVGMTH